MTARDTITRYEIRDVSGLLVAVHCRRDKADGSKTLWWKQPDGTTGLGGVATADLPLYGIGRLGPDPTVVSAEGEKATDALRAAGTQAVGTVTGAASSPGRAPLAELTGRRVILWADNDAGGPAHMQRSAAGLAEIASEIRTVEWSEAPEHGDAADFLFPGKSAAELHAMAEAVADGAEPYAPTGPRTLDDLRALVEGAVAVALEPMTPDPGDSEAAPARDRRQPAESDRVLELAKEAELFHTSAGEPFADVRVDGHRETWPIPSRGLGDWLGQRYWSACQGAPREAALKDALRSLAARARHDGPERQVFLRTGETGGVIYLSLADEQWRAVEIAAEGWRVVAEPPVRFRRGSSSLALPVPVTGGNLEELRRFLNVADEAQWRLVGAWIVFAWLPWGPYPPLILGGQQDSGKSTTARVLRALLDPDEAPLTTAPRDDEDLIVTAANVWCPIYDNLSSLDARLSDMLCRLAEGAGLQRRARYTDTEVVTIKARRPVIITGIGDLATRGDLLSRALTLTLPSLADADRRAEAEFWEAIEAARPRVLGALCDLIVGVLRELPGVVLPAQPRMADFARVGVALERVLAWPEGSFLAAYESNRAAGHEITLESYPIVEALCRLADEHGPWEGSMSDLLHELERRTTEETRHSRRWPGAPHILSSQLDRIAPSLQHRGLTVEHGRSKRGSWVTIRDETNGLPESSVTSVTSVIPNVDRAHTYPETSVTGASPDLGGASPGDDPVTLVTLGDASPDCGASPDANAIPSVDGAHGPSPNEPGDAGDASFPLISRERERGRESPGAPGTIAGASAPDGAVASRAGGDGRRRWGAGSGIARRARPIRPAE